MVEQKLVYVWVKYGNYVDAVELSPNTPVAILKQRILSLFKIEGIAASLKLTFNGTELIGGLIPQETQEKNPIVVVAPPQTPEQQKGIPVAQVIIPPDPRKFHFDQGWLVSWSLTTRKFELSRLAASSILKAKTYPKKPPVSQSINVNEISLVSYVDPPRYSSFFELY